MYMYIIMVVAAMQQFVKDTVIYVFSDTHHFFTQCASSTTNPTSLSQ